MLICFRSNDYFQIISFILYLNRFDDDDDDDWLKRLKKMLNNHVISCSLIPTYTLLTASNRFSDPSMDHLILIHESVHRFSLSLYILLYIYANVYIIFFFCKFISTSKTKMQWYTHKRYLLKMEKNGTWQKNERKKLLWNKFWKNIVVFVFRFVWME